MKRMLTVLASIAVLGILGVGLVSAQPTNFRTHLTGDEEVPVRETRAQGQAILKLSSDGTQLTCKLIASNIDNVVQAHIHLGPEGANGPIVAFLYGLVPAGGGPENGVLSNVTITEADLINALEGEPLSALIEAIEAGNAYVNVHTNDGDATPNEGPGDFPGGEIRGQIH
jgi:CHRD domain-containing protein